MDFTFSKEHQLLRRTYPGVRGARGGPRARDIDENEEVPFDLLKKAAKMGTLRHALRASMVGRARARPDTASWARN